MKHYVLNLLISVDQFFNTAFGGDPDETISSRAAKSARKGHRFGCVLCRFLNWLQDGHCEQSIELDEGERA